jgi:hypothetical protein
MCVVTFFPVPTMSLRGTGLSPSLPRLLETNVLSTSEPRLGSATMPLNIISRPRQDLRY